MYKLFAHKNTEGLKPIATPAGVKLCFPCQQSPLLANYQTIKLSTPKCEKQTKQTIHLEYC